jgi:hypothetical protein
MLRGADPLRALEMLSQAELLGCVFYRESVPEQFDQIAEQNIKLLRESKFRPEHEDWPSLGICVVLASQMERTHFWQELRTIVIDSLQLTRRLANDAHALSSAALMLAKLQRRGNPTRGELGLVVDTAQQQWRASVLLAQLLCNKREIEKRTRDVIEHVEALGLENAWQIEQLSGSEIMAHFGKTRGPWLREMKQQAREWQHNNPTRAASEWLKEHK